ncbi:hypothetical protein UFOVP670_29 [uncultured Caudovirales phage]|uniref:Uncharacterized protein n=1 Tax=uncultured Caudovirales phage TaxID=2100421 RepID=A0A6J5NCI0_9CAUD|nr:hypothetical protein UFOVP670_29 [uncultured Caudovirales phage]
MSKQKKIECAKMIQSVFFFWCRALRYSWIGVFWMFWLCSIVLGAIVAPLAFFYDDPPETLIGKINLGMFCVSGSFLVWAIFLNLSSIILEESLIAVSSILKKIGDLSATVSLHIFAVGGLILVVRTFMIAFWAVAR